MDNKVIDNTFYMDFSIADEFWVEAIKDTYNRSFEWWKNDIRYMTALAITLNWKLRDYYHYGNIKVAKFYDELFKKCDAYILDNFEWDDLVYYYNVTD